MSEPAAGMGTSADSGLMQPDDPQGETENRQTAENHEGTAVNTAGTIEATPHQQHQRHYIPNKPRFHQYDPQSVHGVHHGSETPGITGLHVCYLDGKIPPLVSRKGNPTRATMAQPSTVSTLADNWFSGT